MPQPVFLKQKFMTIPRTTFAKASRVRAGEQRAALLHRDLGGWQERNRFPGGDFKVLRLQVGLVDHSDILRWNQDNPGR